MTDPRALPTLHAALRPVLAAGCRVDFAGDPGRNAVVVTVRHTRGEPSVARSVLVEVLDLAPAPDRVLGLAVALAWADLAAGLAPVIDLRDPLPTCQEPRP